jgi:hypothetical protein
VKPFDADLYNADDPAKEYVIEWLESKGYQAEVNPDQYGIDLLTSRNGKQSGVEVEVKHNWQGYKFPYRTVHISGRKLKFFQDDNNFLLMLNHDWSAALSFAAEEIKKAPTIIKNTIYTQAEKFIELPTNSAKRYKIR